MSRRSVRWRRLLGHPDIKGSGKTGDYRASEAAHQRNGGGCRGSREKLLGTLKGNVTARKAELIERAIR